MFSTVSSPAFITDKAKSDDFDFLSDIDLTCDIFNKYYYMPLKVFVVVFRLPLRPPPYGHWFCEKSMGWGQKARAAEHRSRARLYG